MTGLPTAKNRVASRLKLLKKGLSGQNWDRKYLRRTTIMAHIVHMCIAELKARHTAVTVKSAAGTNIDCVVSGTRLGSRIVG